MARDPAMRHPTAAALKAELQAAAIGDVDRAEQPFGSFHRLEAPLAEGAHSGVVGFGAADSPSCWVSLDSGTIFPGMAVEREHLAISDILF